jgi:hypothetical protein
MGPPAHPSRDGDKIQARKRIDVLVRTGRLPHPSSISYTDCGHTSDDPVLSRHEYDHHLRYGAEHHYDVQVVCSKCHSRREIARGVPVGKRKNAA